MRVNASYRDCRPLTPTLSPLPRGAGVFLSWRLFALRQHLLHRCRARIGGGKLFTQPALHPLLVQGIRDLRFRRQHQRRLLRRCRQLAPEVQWLQLIQLLLRQLLLDILDILLVQEVR